MLKESLKQSKLVNVVKSLLVDSNITTSKAITYAVQKFTDTNGKKWHLQVELVSEEEINNRTTKAMSNES